MNINRLKHIRYLGGKVFINASGNPWDAAGFWIWNMYGVRKHSNHVLLEGV